MIKAFKGFDLNMQCRGYQFKVGETYTHDGVVEACASGFHSCKNPLDVFAYYPPGSSLYGAVEASGAIERHADDSKVASGQLRITAAISLPDYLAAAFQWVLDHCAPSTSEHATGHQSASSATGYQSASSATGHRSASSATGHQSASSATGDQSASSATGYRSASSATGDQSASSATGHRSASSATGHQSASSATGDRSASSATGYRSASSATGYRSASSATGDQSASSATGDQSASSATGDRSASSATGDQSASSATGDRSASSATGQAAVALNIGRLGKARAAVCGAIVLCERDSDGGLLHIRASKVGENGIKPDVFYTLRHGEFVEADAS